MVACILTHYKLLFHFIRYVYVLEQQSRVYNTEAGNILYDQVNRKQH